MSRYQGNVLVTNGQSATFDPPIDGIFVLSDNSELTGATSVDCVINGVTVALDFNTLVKSQLAANNRHILLPNCTSIAGAPNFRYVALRDAGYPPKAPNDTIIG